MTANQDLVVALSSQPEQQLAQVRLLLTSCLADLGQADGEKNCPFCGGRQDGGLAGHLVKQHAQSQEDTVFSQQLGLLPPERLSQFLGGGPLCRMVAKQPLQDVCLLW